MKKIIFLIALLFSAIISAQTTFENKVVLKSVQTKNSRVGKVLIRENQEVKEIPYSLLKNEPEVTSDWVDVPLWGDNAAYKCHYRIKGDMVELEIVNLVPSFYNSAVTILELPSEIRPKGTFSGLFPVGYEIYTFKPYVFNIAPNGSLFLYPNDNLSSGTLYLHYQYKLF